MRTGTRRASFGSGSRGARSSCGRLEGRRTGSGTGLGKALAYPVWGQLAHDRSFSTRVLHTPKGLCIVAPAWRVSAYPGRPDSLDDIGWNSVRCTMPQSLSNVGAHRVLVFSTKDRQAFVGVPELRAEMHRHLGGASSGLGCSVVRFGPESYPGQPPRGRPGLRYATPSA